MKIKKNEIAKLRKTKNAHKKNFENIDVKIRILIINKQILKKIIQNFERKLRNMKSIENFNEKNHLLIFDIELSNDDMCF